MAERVGSNPIKCGFESHPGHLRIRRATVADAHAVAVVQVAGWHTAYRGIVPDALLAAMTVQGREARWREILASGSVVLVAEEGEEVVGWTAVWPEVGEVKGLYVRPDRARRGIGSALLRAAHRELAAAGREEAVLWVFAANAAARAFYAAHGYVADGAAMIHPESGAEEVRLFRRLVADGDREPPGPARALNG